MHPLPSAIVYDTLCTQTQPLQDSSLEPCGHATAPAQATPRGCLTHAVVCAQLPQVDECCSLHGRQAAPPEAPDASLLRQRCCYAADAAELSVLPLPRQHGTHISLHLDLHACQGHTHTHTQAGGSGGVRQERHWHTRCRPQCCCPAAAPSKASPGSMLGAKEESCASAD